MSDIEFESINENFPIAGQDNDTQTFRDNFEATKTGLRVASEEIEDLQDNTARTDQNTDFNGFGIENAVLNRTFQSTWIYGDRAGNIEIDFLNGHYQALNITEVSSLVFTNFPSEDFIEVAPDEEGGTVVEFRGIAGKIRLEIRNTGEDPVYPVEFITSGSGVSEYRKNFSEPLAVGESPIILEIWRYSASEIFINLIDDFNDQPSSSEPIQNLTDVEFENLEDRDLIFYDADTELWKNRPDTSLSVSVDNPITGDTIIYDSVNEEWKNIKNTIEFDVSVVDIGNDDRFFIDGARIEDAGLTFRVGKTYRFNLTQTVLDFPTSVRFSTTPDTETPATINDFSDGVIVNTDQNYVEITITETTPKILYLWGFETGFDTSKIGGETPIQIETPQIFLGSTELESAPSLPVDLTKTTTRFSTGGDSVLDSGTLADGVEGQIKILIMEQYGGNDKIIEVLNFGWGGSSGVIVFDQTGSACTLQFINGKWFCIGNNGATFS